MDTSPEKPERSMPVWLDEIISPATLDFVAPFPLETSLKLLKQQDDTRYFRRHRLMFYLTPNDENTFSFHLKRRGSHSGEIEARGSLKRAEAESTLVTAQVNLTHGKLLFVILGLAFILFTMAVIYNPQAALFFVPIMVIILVSMYGLRRQRHKIAAVIEEALRAAS